MCACIRTYVRTYVNVCVHVCIHTYLCVCVVDAVVCLHVCLLIPPPTVRIDTCIRCSTFLSFLCMQKRLFLKPFYNPQDPVERNLMLHQAIQDVVSDRFPVTYEEAIYLSALRAHGVLGSYSEATDLLDYV